jgi:hypothetical protein
MGAARLTARTFLVEGKARPFHGSLLQLGRQDVYFGMNELTAWAAAQVFPLRSNGRVTLKVRPSFPNPECIDDVTFFNQIGFDEVRSCDASDYEGADYIVDLNRPAAVNLTDRFDLIFDGGTCEHVFHFPQALANIHAMLKVGGRVIHGSPVSNYVDHGFYSFSPTLFYDYYTVNNYRVELCLLQAHTRDHFAESAIFSYVPGSLDHLTFGGFTAQNFGKYDMFHLFFVATKLAQSTSGVIPIQGTYRRTWGGEVRPTDAPQQFKFLGHI